MNQERIIFFAPFNKMGPLTDHEVAVLNDDSISKGFATLEVRCTSRLFHKGLYLDSKSISRLNMLSQEFSMLEELTLGSFKAHNQGKGFRLAAGIAALRLRALLVSTGGDITPEADEHLVRMFGYLRASKNASSASEN